MIQSNGAVGVCLSSLLLEWRRGALRICSADAGDLAGLPFPKQGVQLRGFALELFRNGDGAWVICKYLLPAYEDGEDGVSYHYWKIKYRRLLRREGVYKMEARKSWLMPCEILAEYYNPVGQDGEVVWEPKAT
ncbi:MAG: hypothetical protein GX589_00395, partial [Deltaproteobacteria bacterium]|nr:hypothetical protein [Deltaproteobacteria bacterium]